MPATTLYNRAMDPNDMAHRHNPGVLRSSADNAVRQLRIDLLRISRTMGHGDGLLGMTDSQAKEWNALWIR